MSHLNDAALRHSAFEEAYLCRKDLCADSADTSGADRLSCGDSNEFDPAKWQDFGPHSSGARGCPRLSHIAQVLGLKLGLALGPLCVHHRLRLLSRSGNVPHVHGRDLLRDSELDLLRVFGA